MIRTNPRTVLSIYFIFPPITTQKFLNFDTSSVSISLEINFNIFFLMLTNTPFYLLGCTVKYNTLKTELEPTIFLDRFMLTPSDTTVSDTACSKDMSAWLSWKINLSK